MSAPTAQQAKASARHIRITARKMRLVVDGIRGKDVKVAEDILRFIPRGAATPIAKILKAAKANAVENHSMIEDNLFVKTVYVDEGTTIKRMIPRARGRGDSLLKRTSHITIILEERVAPKRNSLKGTRKTAKKTKAAAGGENGQ